MGKNVTEQQRIAAALESMVDTSGEESTKKNVTEQQRIASALEAMAEGGGGGGGGDTGITLQINRFQPDPSTPATYTTVPSFDELSLAQVEAKDFSNVTINGEKTDIFDVYCEYNWNDNESTLETIYVSCGDFRVSTDAYGHMSAGITTTLYTISHNGVTSENGPSIESHD